jgi:hypothetical protein
VSFVSLPGASDYLVMAGRSLREVEKRVDQLTTNLLLGWIVSQVILLALIACPELLPGISKV